MEVTLGGDRLGSGNKQTVKMHDYEMSSFNLEQDFKSTMAPGVLYPFLKLIGTNHGTFDIDMETFVRTLPTKGPLFGSYKLQIDLFECPMRLYQAVLHNNAQKIGMKMNQVYLPKIKFGTFDYKGMPLVKGANMYNRQISDNCLAKYMGLSGIATNKKYATDEGDSKIYRKINAIPYLAYYDIFKNYYANKQEEKAYVITPGKVLTENSVKIEEVYYINENGTLKQVENVGTNNWIDPGQRLINQVWYLKVTGPQEEWMKSIELTIGDDNDSNNYTLYDLNEESEGVTVNFINPEPGNGNSNLEVIINKERTIDTYCPNAQDLFVKISMVLERAEFTNDIHLEPFALQNIDDMRMAILSKNNLGQEFVISDNSNDWNTESGTDGTGLPYSALINEAEVDSQSISYNAFEMNGLVVKTYQSDLFNNWLDSEWIDGEEGIASLTAISTQDGKFTVDSFIFAEKLYDIYNRIATGGGSYEDWQDAVYGEGAVRKAETPMYIGGMAAEIMFEEVISNSETKIDGNFQALGSLGGKGTQVGSRGGKNIHVKLREPGYIIGIASLTPRICYSQGNDWDLTELDTMDDLHKPGLDGIGFQDLIIERMAWWNTRYDPDTEKFERDSAGKQTAWINYQTAVDKCYGDFAKQDGYAFMVLNRNYEMNEETMYGVNDITTYIDPKKYNYAFAYDELAAQNFWSQIHSNVIARRKMGAQQIPNL